MLSEYDKIILDVSGTLYDDDKTPFIGSKKFLIKYYKKILIFSNIGSKSGKELNMDLEKIFNIKIPKVRTSYDLMVDFLSQNNYKNIYHYGNQKVHKKLTKKFNNIYFEKENKKFDAVIFTSLISNNWISKTQDALNIIISNNPDVLLGNPDRISINPPYSFTVSLFHDAILEMSRKFNNKHNYFEFGKPHLTNEKLNIELNDKVVFIGDNPWTDIDQGKKLKHKTVLIKKNNHNINFNNPDFIVNSLNELL